MTHWTAAHPRVTAEHLGLIPSFLNEADPRPAREQLHEAYAHGGGWHPFYGFELQKEGAVETWWLKYPEDPPVRMLAYTTLREETICLFQFAWVAIVQKDGSFEIARMD